MNTHEYAWCEKDAVWDDERDEYALCCTEQHRIRVEQEAIRWMSQYRIKVAPSINNPISANAAFDSFAEVSVVNADVSEAYDQVQVEQDTNAIGHNDISGHVDGNLLLT